MFDCAQQRRAVCDPGETRVAERGAFLKAGLRPPPPAATALTNASRPADSAAVRSKARPAPARRPASTRGAAAHPTNSSPPNREKERQKSPLTNRTPYEPVHDDKCSDYCWRSP